MELHVLLMIGIFFGVIVGALIAYYLDSKSDS